MGRKILGVLLGVIGLAGADFADARQLGPKPKAGTPTFRGPISTVRNLGCRCGCGIFSVQAPQARPVTRAARNRAVQAVNQALAKQAARTGSAVAGVAGAGGSRGQTTPVSYQVNHVNDDIRVVNVLGRRSPIFGYGDSKVYEGTVSETTVPDSPTLLAGEPPAARRVESDRAPASQPAAAPPKEAERPSTEAEPPKTKPEKAPPVRRPLEDDNEETYVVSSELP